MRSYTGSIANLKHKKAPLRAGLFILSIFLEIHLVVEDWEESELVILSDLSRFRQVGQGQNVLVVGDVNDVLADSDICVIAAHVVIAVALVVVASAHMW